MEWKLNNSRKCVLKPMDRTVEVFCGLIMVMTFTLTIDQADAGRETVHQMLFAALGCNLAWGIIDGTLLVMARLGERRSGLLALQTVRSTDVPDEAYQAISDALPPVVADVLVCSDYERIRQLLKDSPEPRQRIEINRDDLLAGLGVFLLVVLSTVPVVIPFIFMSRVALALRVSNAIAIGLLFVVGFLFGRVTGRNPWRTGFVGLGLGILLAAVALVLGG